MKKLLFLTVLTLLFLGLYAQNSTSPLMPIKVKKEVLNDKKSLNLTGYTGAPYKGEVKTKLGFITKKTEKNDVATVTLNVIGDPWENGTGFQLLLDADAEIFDYFDDWMWEDDEQFYIHSEYKIPENASYDFNNPQVILNGTGSVDIPEGVYDFIFFRPWPFLELNFICNWAGTEDMAAGDDYLFLAGFEYIFTIEFQSYVVFETPEDIKLSQIIIPQPSLDLTNQEIISVVLYNNGIVNITGEIELAYKVNDGDEIVETYFIDELLPDAEITYTFNTKADFSEVGFYTVEARVDYEQDVNPYNNTLTGLTKKLTLIELPFFDNFDTKNSLLNWSTIDGNNDGYSWQYDDWFLTDADGGKGCLQVLCQTYGADEYLITDPVNISEAGKYTMSFYAFALGNDKLKVLYGTTYNVEEMELLEVVYPSTAGWDINMVNVEFETPGNYFFAFHYFGVSAEGAEGVNFDNFKMEADSIVGIPDIVMNEQQLKFYPNPSNGQFTVFSEKNIETIELYDMMGKKVFADAPKMQTVLINTHLTNGVYTYKVVLEDNSVLSGKIIVQ